jgi:hypothetical protein
MTFQNKSSISVWTVGLDIIVTVERLFCALLKDSRITWLGWMLVYRLLNPLSFVAFKMGHLRGGPSRTGAKGAYLARSTRCRLLRAFDSRHE